MAPRIPTGHPRSRATPLHAALAVKRRASGQGCDPFAIEHPERWQMGEHGEFHDAADARDGLQLSHRLREGLAGRRRPLEGGLIEPRDLLIEPPDMVIDRAQQGRGAICRRFFSAVPPRPVGGAGRRWCCFPPPRHSASFHLPGRLPCRFGLRPGQLDELADRPGRGDPRC
jgi:hypothetical protein